MTYQERCFPQNTLLALKQVSCFNKKTDIKNKISCKVETQSQIPRTDNRRKLHFEGKVGKALEGLNIMV